MDQVENQYGIIYPIDCGISSIDGPMNFRPEQKTDKKRKPFFRNYITSVFKNEPSSKSEPIVSKPEREPYQSSVHDFKSIAERRVEWVNAVCIGDLDIMRKLLDIGCSDIESTVNFEGHTALHWSMIKGFISMARLLLAYKVDADTFDWEGLTPLHVLSAISVRNDKFNEFIESPSSSTRGVYDQSDAIKNHTCMIQLLLDHNASINLKTNNGRTALHLAAYAGNLEIVEFLMGHGADIRSVDCCQQTALHLSALANHLSVIELLLSKGADIAATDKYGETALHLAVSKGYKESAQLLLQQGANINGRNLKHITSLDYALIRFNLRMVKLLYDNGAHIRDTALLPKLMRFVTLLIPTLAFLYFLYSKLITQPSTTEN